MTQRLRIRAREGHAAAAAGAGFARDFFIRGQQGAAVRLVSRFSAPAASGGFTRGGRLMEGASLEGGFEEFCEFWPRRALSSATC